MQNFIDGAVALEELVVDVGLSAGVNSHEVAFSLVFCHCFIYYFSVLKHTSRPNTLLIISQIPALFLNQSIYQLVHLGRHLVILQENLVLRLGCY